MTRNATARRERTRLACAIAAVLALAAAGPGVADEDAGDWIRFRNDPAQRLFPTLPGPRDATPPAAPAAIWPVTHCGDDGPGSLRAAVAGAATGDTVDLTALACSTITLETGAIEIGIDDLTLAGPGRNELAIDGNQLDRVLVHPRGGTLHVRGLTLRNGRISAENFDITGGGCVASAGYLLIEDSTVRDCASVAIGSYGGGIYAYSLALQSSTLASNRALGTHIDAGTAAFGGGAFVYQMLLLDSTVSGNLAEHRTAPWRDSYDIGGGIVSVRGGFVSGSTVDHNIVDGRGGGIATFTSMAVSNSTFSGNVAAAGMGGALFVRRPSTFDIGNSTISANSASHGGGGIWIGADTSYLHSSIVHGNAGGSGPADIENPFPITIGGHANLVGEVGAQVVLPPDTLDADPLLAPLAYYGGTTRTHALRAGSPAVDTGSNTANLPRDQRGEPFPRVYGPSADIGAFEQQGVPVGPAASPVPAWSSWLSGLLALLVGACAWPRLRHGRARGA
ncbi:MAG: hypothetical protein EOP90_14955 [Lysobacteraceae bacterium]|nr:MAG: hypothetical protein EOP90_14955 [Xanthomonadaceae bacterium]